MKELEELSARVREHIPLTRHLGFRFAARSPGRLEVTAGLAENVNDKGTFFAGSQAALLALSGWALTTLEAESVVGPVDVVAVESSLKHLAPAPFDARFVAIAGGADLERFRSRLGRRGKARLPLQVSLVGPEDELATTYEGLFLARKLEEPS